MLSTSKALQFYQQSQAEGARIHTSRTAARRRKGALRRIEELRPFDTEKTGPKALYDMCGDAGNGKLRPGTGERVLVIECPTCV